MIIWRLSHSADQLSRVPFHYYNDCCNRSGSGVMLSCCIHTRNNAFTYLKLSADHTMGCGQCTPRQIIDRRVTTDGIKKPSLRDKKNTTFIPILIFVFFIASSSSCDGRKQCCTGAYYDNAICMRRYRHKI